MQIIENNKGTHIMSTKDLCLVKYVNDLKNIGIDSLKVEGRTKSLYYVSTVTKAYRKVLDNKWDSDFAFTELKKAGNRGYTEGFFLGNNDSKSYSYDISKGLAGADFLGVFLQDLGENKYKLLIKNKISLNDEIEIITPNFSTLAKVMKIIHTKKGEVEVANTNDEIIIEFSFGDSSWQNEAQFALARTVGIKE